MEKYFTTKIYRSFAGVDNSFTAHCVDVQLTPDSDDLSVDEVAIYWRNCVMRRSSYPAGSYLIEVSFTRHPIKAFVEVYKPLK